jgi:uncharacterized protein YjbI with pentapeptide repeats
MIQFKLFNNFNKKKIALIALIILALLFILGNYNREVIKSYISEVVTSPSIRVHLVNIAKVAIPLKNLILMRGDDDQIALLRSSGSCTFCDLSQVNFKGSDLKGVDLRYAILIGANLSNTNLSGANLLQANLQDANLKDANLDDTHLNKTNFTRSNLSGIDLSSRNLRKLDFSETNLSDTNFTGAILIDANLSEANISDTALIQADLSGANLDGVDLRNKDLTGVNLSGVDLRNKDLTGTILTQADLSGANLDGVDLRNKDLTGVNLSGVDLRNKDLTGTILKDAKKVEITIKNPNNSNWSALNEIEMKQIIRYDLSGDVQYLATKNGFLFESKNNESRLVLDLNNDSQFPFYSNSHESGLLDIVSKNKLLYVSYTSQDINGLRYLVVDEYSMNFTKVRNIIKIGGFAEVHFGGNLFFDSLGKLYLSVGDGRQFPAQSKAQSLNSLMGKILRLDVSILKLEPEIVVYGIRNPWGVTIDSKDRLFILQCGNDNVEAVYLLNDLYSAIPANLGWPVFEGSIKIGWHLFEGSVKIGQDPIMFNDVLAPIFQYNNRPGCATAGVYLNDIESFLFADFYGTIRLLKQQENGDWYLLHKYKQEKFIWGLGLDKKTKKIFVAPKNLELEILVDQVKLNQ